MVNNLGVLFRERSALGWPATLVNNDEREDYPGPSCNKDARVWDVWAIIKCGGPETWIVLQRDKYQIVTRILATRWSGLIVSPSLKKLERRVPDSSQMSNNVR